MSLLRALAARESGEQRPHKYVIVGHCRSFPCNDGLPPSQTYGGAAKRSSTYSGVRPGHEATSSCCESHTVTANGPCPTHADHCFISWRGVSAGPRPCRASLVSLTRRGQEAIASTQLSFAVSWWEAHTGSWRCMIHKTRSHTLLLSWATHKLRRLDCGVLSGLQGPLQRTMAPSLQDAGTHTTLACS